MGAQERTMQAEERVEERIAEVDEKHRITSQKINELSWKEANCDADLAMLAKARLELESQAQEFSDKMLKRETEFERLRDEREAEMEEKDAALREDVARMAAMRLEETCLQAAKDDAQREANRLALKAREVEAAADKIAVREEVEMQMERAIAQQIQIGETRIAEAKKRTTEAQERTMQAEERVEERVAEVDEKHRITSQKINELSWKKADCDA